MNNIGRNVDSQSMKAKKPYLSTFCARAFHQKSKYMRLYIYIYIVDKYISLYL